MNSQSNAIKYAPGFPGYGDKGKDGSIGLNGISLYFSRLNGATDYSLISNAIFNNYVLDSTDKNIPGYPIRTYQTGDYFIDISSEIYVIDKSAAPYYKKTGLKLNTYGLFEDTQIRSTYGFKRYTNTVSNLNRNTIDTVYAKSNANYSTSPTDIYGVKPENFGKIFYSNIDFLGYSPFMVFTSGTFNNNALAIVKNSSFNSTIFHIGNVDDNGKHRDTKLVFDVNQLVVTRDDYNKLNEESPRGTVLTTYEINSPYLFNSESITKNYFSVVTTTTTAVLSWDKAKFLKTTDTAILNKIKCDLVFYSPSVIDGSSFNYNNPYNNSIIFEDIETDGTITLTGLKDGVSYKSYLKFYDNGWTKTSGILDCATNLIPVITLYDVLDTELTTGKYWDIPALTKGATYSVDVSTNVGDWTISVNKPSPNDTNFCTVTPKTGNGKGKLTIKVDTNNELSTPNVNRITLESLQYGIKQYFYFRQIAFEPELSAIPDAFTFDKDASNDIVVIQTNLGEWNFKVSDPWISAYAPNGTIGNNPLNISVQSNQDVSREGNIKIDSITRPDISINIPIRQEIGYDIGTVNMTFPNPPLHNTDKVCNIMSVFTCNKTFSIPRELTVKYTLRGRLNPYHWNFGPYGNSEITTVGLAAFTYNGNYIIKSSDINTYIKNPADMNFTIIQGPNNDNIVQLPNYPGDHPTIFTVETTKTFTTNGIASNEYPSQIQIKRPNNYIRLQDVSMNVELISSKIAGSNVYDILGPNTTFNTSLLDPSLFINVYTYDFKTLINSFDVVGDDNMIQYKQYGLQTSGYAEFTTNDPDYITFRFPSTPGASVEADTLEVHFKTVTAVRNSTITIKRGTLVKTYPVTIRPAAVVSDITIYDSTGAAVEDFIFDQWNRIFKGTIKSPIRWTAEIKYQGEPRDWLDYPGNGPSSGEFQMEVSSQYASQKLYAELTITDISETYSKTFRVRVM